MYKVKGWEAKGIGKKVSVGPPCVAAYEERLLRY